MRIIAVILTVVLVAAGALACTAPVPSSASSAPTQAASSSPAATETPVPTSAAPATDSPAPSATATTQPTAAATPKDYNQIGADLMAAESLGTLKLGLTQTDLIAAIGQPDSKSKLEVWGADGLNHSTWTFKSKGLSIDMAGEVGSKGDMNVNVINAEAPCDLPTAKGIKIGDKSADVLAAYGFAVEDQTNDGTKDSITAGTAFNGVIFGMKDGLVVSIFIGASAE